MRLKLNLGNFQVQSTQIIVVCYLDLPFILPNLKPKKHLKALIGRGSKKSRRRTCRKTRELFQKQIYNHPCSFPSLQIKDKTVSTQGIEFQVRSRISTRKNNSPVWTSSWKLINVGSGIKWSLVDSFFKSLNGGGAARILDATRVLNKGRVVTTKFRTDFLCL